MTKYIIHEGSKEIYHAGSKATKDCEKILLKNGFQPINICSYQGAEGLWVKLKKRMQLVKFLRFKRKSIVVVQHPMYIGSFYMKVLQVVKSLKKIRLIFIIHDLESLRNVFREYHDLYVTLDDRMLCLGDSLIVHNEKMKSYLIEERGISEEKLVTLGIFDYLADKKNSEAEQKLEKEKKEIVIAGNLDPEKSGYVYKLRDMHMDMKVCLYGVNYLAEDTEDRNWNYRGAYPPTELPSILKGDFGLVWDGSETSSCVGNTGNYLRYNNPHKVSLYIAAELPIIIWKQAALADYVLENQIGIAVEDLKDLETVLPQIEKEEYFQMKKKIKPLAEKVRRGDFLTEAYCVAEQSVLKK